ncbi:MAG TPA: DNA-deoxyinosine glycosylase [Lachnospiraceae bacterium]|nr:DNA-deoxyinosine glycosylase [Lachnospiraceae bacterium]
MKANKNLNGEPVFHEIAPVYDENSKVLILGSFPSVKSRESGFFYGHPQNRFWKVLAGILGIPVPMTINEKKAMLLDHSIAVWDVIASCRITGSSDSSIKDVVPNDFEKILSSASIERICANGATAWKLYEKYVKPSTGMNAVKLPSTSPANAAWSLERLIKYWKEYIK